MVDVGPNKLLGPCPREDCNGQLAIFNGPRFGSKPPTPKCLECGYVKPLDSDDDDVVYIGWNV